MNEKLRLLIAEVFKVPAAEITPESGPHSISGWDSAAHMHLVLELENKFGIQFDDEEIAELVSFKVIQATLEKHQSKQGK
jgi:acyl carrier protein